MKKKFYFLRVEHRKKRCIELIKQRLYAAGNKLRLMRCTVIAQQTLNIGKIISDFYEIRIFL